MTAGPEPFRPVRSFASTPPHVIDGLLVQGTITALAVVERVHRAAVLNLAVTALVGGTGSFLGRQVVTPVDKVLVVVNTTRAEYDLAPVVAMGQVECIRVTPSGDDGPGTWRELAAHANEVGASAVIVDLPRAIAPLEHFDRTTLALFGGAATKPGTQPATSWSGAFQRFWLSGALVCEPEDALSIGESWQVDLTPPRGINEVDRVQQTAVVANTLKLSRDPASAIGQLARQNILGPIWGAADALGAVSRHRAIWDAVFANEPIDLSNEPPF